MNFVPCSTAMLEFLRAYQNIKGLFLWPFSLCPRKKMSKKQNKDKFMAIPNDYKVRTHQYIPLYIPIYSGVKGICPKPNSKLSESSKS